MRTTIKWMLMIVALAVSIMAAAPGVRPVTASRNNRTLTAVTESGQTYLAARELGVDLDFPAGQSGKGQLYILFEPSTGFFLQIFGWERNDYPRTWIAQQEARSRVGVTADRLVIVTFSDGAGIIESTEKASNLDDAEAKSLKWIGDHLAQIETRTDRELYRATYRPLGRSDFPKGFLRPGLQHGSIEMIDPLPGLRVRLVDMVYKGGGWELTLESTETQRKAKVFVFRRGTEWFTGPIRSE